MSDDPKGPMIDGWNQNGGAVASLASRALSVLATRRSALDRQFIERMIVRLEEAVLDRNPEKRLSVLEELRGAGIPDAQIAEDLIPEVAKRLGTAWCEDNMSFADVTIGSARLQALVRDLGTPDPDPTKARVGSIAVIVPSDESHTLGAMVLTSRLRRLGVSVRLILGTADDAVLAILQRSTFDAIFISASHSEKLAKLNRFVSKIKMVLRVPTPVVVGGSVVERGVAVEKYVGADYVASDVERALQACGLKIENSISTTRAMDRRAVRLPESHE